MENATINVSKTEKIGPNRRICIQNSEELKRQSIGLLLLLTIQKLNKTKVKL
jgi:hypothetical protein